MNYLRAISLLLLASSAINAAEIVEITATLVKVTHLDPHQLSQIELRKEVLIARTGGEKDLLKLSAVVESGKWATIKRGREFWYPRQYSEAKIYQAVSDDGTYSVPNAGPASGNDTIIIPNSPMSMGSIELGAAIKVCPTVKDDGLIYLEGQFTDTVFEGLSEESIPIKVETKKLIGQNRVHPIMTSRIDQPVFRTVEEQFGVMLPYSAGSSVNAIRLREAQTTYTYLIPIVLGNTVFGAPGKIELETNDAKPGPIMSTVMKATMVKDFFIQKKVEDTRRENGILILDVKKIELPTSKRFQGSGEKRILIDSKFAETEKLGADGNPVLTDEAYQAAIRDLNKRKSTDLMTAPSVVVRPGMSGKIEVVQEFIFPTEYSAPALNPPGAADTFPVIPTTPLKFETRNTGVSLSVNASLEDGDMIRLKVKSSILSFEGFLDYGNPVMSVKTGMVKKIKPAVVSENRAEMPVFPFRSTETEFLVPNGSHVAMTMIFDYYNKDHQKTSFLPFMKEKVSEIKTPRYLTIYLSPKILDRNGNP